MHPFVKRALKKRAKCCFCHTILAIMFLLWNKWLALVTKYISCYNSRSYLDHLSDEYFDIINFTVSIIHLVTIVTDLPEHWNTLKVLCVYAMWMQVTFPTHTQAAFSQIMSTLYNAVFAANLQGLPDWTGLCLWEENKVLPAFFVFFF